LLTPSELLSVILAFRVREARAVTHRSSLPVNFPSRYQDSPKRWRLLRERFENQSHGHAAAVRAVSISADQISLADGQQSPSSACADLPLDDQEGDEE
jgi:hypothetical protein